MVNGQFRYEEVVNKIKETITNLQLRPGDKIPSVRKVSADLNVSTTTVFQAYAMLEARGIIVSHPRSGFYVNATAANKLSPAKEKEYIPLPEKVEVNTMDRIMVKNTRKYSAVNFSTLSMPNEFLPITKINKAVQASMKEVVVDNFQYPFLEGHPRLLKQIALHSFEWGKSIKPEDILVTNGCMEALNLCLAAVTKPGDTVAIESPAYHGVLQCLESKGLNAIGIRVDPETGLDLAELERALNTSNITACLFMPACQNPVGCSMPDANKIKLVKMLGERNIPLIEDDALGELHFSKLRPLPAKAYDTYDNVLYCSSFSKTLVPGFRIGWVAAGKYQAEVEKLKFASNVSTNSLLQDAIARYLESGNYKAHLRKLRFAVQSQIISYRSAVTQYFPKEVKISMPVGGISLWIELPENVNSLELQKQALKKGIAICPGKIFSTSDNCENFIRINCGQLYNNKIEQAVKTLGKLVHALSIQTV